MSRLALAAALGLFAGLLAPVVRAEPPAAPVQAAIDRAFRDCRSWCQVRIEAARAIAEVEMRGRDMFQPKLVLHVRIRNVGDAPVRLTDRSVAFQTSDAEDPRFGRYAITDGPYQATWDRQAPALDATLQPGESMLVRYNMWNVPSEARSFHLKVDGQFALGAQPWSAEPLMADFRELERNLFLEERLRYVPPNAPAPARAADFLGEWKTDRDQRLVVSQEGNRIVAKLIHSNGVTQEAWTFGATVHPTRLWSFQQGRSSSSFEDGRLYLDLPHSGALIMSSKAMFGPNFTATRVAPETPPAQTPPAQTPPAQTPPAPTPAPQPAPPTGPQPAAGFEAVGKFDVRFEGLERPRGSAVVRAIVTIRNATETIQHLPSGTFRVILTDADGAGQERGQLWRGSGEPAALFNSTPVLQPGAALKVRFVFNPDTPQLRSLTLIEGQEQVVFDLSSR
jgi:hypothetical protein